jgi:hypothetical protein
VGRADAFRLGLALGVAVSGCCHDLALDGHSLFVAMNGDDGGSGSIEQPLARIAEAFKRARPGDTVYVREGLYRESLYVDHGGTSWDAPIRVVAYPGELATMRPAAGKTRVIAFAPIGGAFELTAPLHIGSAAGQRRRRDASDAGIDETTSAPAASRRRNHLL